MEQDSLLLQGNHSIDINFNSNLCKYQKIELFIVNVDTNVQYYEVDYRLLIRDTKYHKTKIKKKTFCVIKIELSPHHGRGGINDTSVDPIVPLPL